MAKTITLRLKENIYNMFKLAAEGEHRSISNFIEFAALAYLSEESFISDSEMEEIKNDTTLMTNLEKAQQEIEEGKFTIIE